MSGRADADAAAARGWDRAAPAEVAARGGGGAASGSRTPPTPAVLWCAQRTHHTADVAGEHVRAADLGHRSRGHPGDRLEHQPLAHPVAHLANQNFREILALERAGPCEQVAQGVEFAAARVPALGRRDLGKTSFDFGQCEGGRRILGALTQEHLDRVAEIGGGGEDLLSLTVLVWLVLPGGERDGDFPDCAPTDLQRLFVALGERASNP